MTNALYSSESNRGYITKSIISSIYLMSHVSIQSFTHIHGCSIGALHTVCHVEFDLKLTYCIDILDIDYSLKIDLLHIYIGERLSLKATAANSLQAFAKAVLKLGCPPPEGRSLLSFPARAYHS